MLRESIVEEMTKKQKQKYCEWAINRLIEKSGDVLICFTMSTWRNLKSMPYAYLLHSREAFPELYDEVIKAIKKTGNSSSINYSKTYKRKGRIRLLRRVLKKI